MATFGTRLSELRKQRDLTQRDIAKLLGVTPKAVSFYENDERQAPNEIVKMLAIFFDVPLDYLLARENSNDKDIDYFRITQEAKKNGVSASDLKTALDFITRARARVD